MSGGCFNYACYKAVDDDVLEGLNDYRDIQAYLIRIGRTEAAEEVKTFIEECYEAQKVIGALNQKGVLLYPLLRAAEWTCSGDTSVDVIDSAYLALKLKEI